MTQEEKAKAYDEALERAREYHNVDIDNTMDVKARGILEYLFPELAGSEDDRIVKCLLNYFNHVRYNGLDLKGTDVDEVIAWLEKQDESYTKKDVDNAYIEGMAFAKDELEKQSDSPIKWNKNTKDCKPKVSHSVLMKTTHGIAEGEWQGKHWHQYRWAGLVRDADVLSWMELSNLEKQGEQKVSCTTLVETGNGGINALVTRELSTNGCDEQKSANEVEPKFKVGDWVVYYRNDSSREVLQVYDIRDGRYYFTDNVHFSWSVKECNEKSHLWTIKDAKEGDVLTYVTDEEDLWIMIYWSLYEPYEGHIHYHALLVNDEFYDKGTCCICINDLKPATKEQYDLLFQKMKEAGYEWDAEKKELKKIEQKSAWSEEDEKNLLKAIWYVENPALNVVKDIMLSEWLKSLKQRIGG